MLIYKKGVSVEKDNKDFFFSFCVWVTCFHSDGCENYLFTSWTFGIMTYVIFVVYYWTDNGGSFLYNQGCNLDFRKLNVKIGWLLNLNSVSFIMIPKEKICGHYIVSGSQNHSISVIVCLTSVLLNIIFCKDDPVLLGNCGQHLTYHSPPFFFFLPVSPPFNPFF